MLLQGQSGHCAGLLGRFKRCHPPPDAFPYHDTGSRGKSCLQPPFANIETGGHPLEEIGDGTHARHVIKDWMKFYKTERPRSALERCPPNNAYWAKLEQ